MPTPPNLPRLCWLELLELVGVDEGGVRVELFQAAVDHVLDQLAHLVLVELA